MPPLPRRARRRYAASSAGSSWVRGESIGHRAVRAEGRAGGGGRQSGHGGASTDRAGPATCPYITTYHYDAAAIVQPSCSGEFGGEELGGLAGQRGDHPARQPAGGERDPLFLRVHARLVRGRRGERRHEGGGRRAGRPGRGPGTRRSPGAGRAGVRPARAPCDRWRRTRGRRRARRRRPADAAGLPRPARGRAAPGSRPGRPVRGSPSAEAARTAPKQVSRGPSAVSSTAAGETPAWVRPWPCAVASASARVAPTARTVGSGSGPPWTASTAERERRKVRAGGPGRLTGGRHPGHRGHPGTEEEAGASASAATGRDRCRAAGC